MNIKINKLLLWFLFITFCQNLYTLTLVYNMRIRRLFNLSAAAGFLNKKKKPIWIATAVPIYFKVDRNIIDNDLGLNICHRSVSVGSILNARYISPKKWWFEATTGIETETAKYRGTLNLKACRTGLDDIVLSGGYNFVLNKKSQLAFYGLAGFPARRKVTAQEAQNTLVGTRFFSLGIGSEFSYNAFFSAKQALNAIFQVRFLHFFDRKWFPILPPDAKIKPGNLTDLLFTLQYRRKLNIFETGYNPTFFTNQGTVINNEKNKLPNYVRHAVYLTYSHIFKKFPVIKKPVLLGSGFSISRSNRFDTKIFSWWINFSIIF